MKERPILSSGPLVRAILDGAKTQTRRLVTPLPRWDPMWGTANGGGGAWIYEADRERTKDRWGMAMTPDVIRDMATAAARGWGLGAGCPYGAPGDRLWVRESFRAHYFDNGAPAFAADWTGESADTVPKPKWTPSIHMPRALSRIDLEVTRVRVQRLHDITEGDALAEGVSTGRIPVDDYGPERIGYVLGPDDGRCVLYPTALEAFAIGWNAINGERATWDSNPWVWAIDFKRVRP